MVSEGVVVDSHVFAQLIDAGVASMVFGRCLLAFVVGRGWWLTSMRVSESLFQGYLTFFHDLQIYRNS